MKKAMKKILAVVVTAATAASIVGASVSAATDPTNPNLIEYGVLSGSNKYTIDYGTGAYYGDVVVTVKAQNWVGGMITASVSKPAGVEITKYKWIGTNIETKEGPTASSTKVSNGAAGYSMKATCTVTIKYTKTIPGGSVVVTKDISVSVSSNHVYANSTAAGNKWDATVSGGTGSYFDDDYYWNNGYWGDGYWDGNYYWTDYGYWYNGKWYYYDWYRPSSSSRYEYEVNWSNDTFYYDGSKQLPTATVTIGGRTVELDVRLTSGDGTSVGTHRVTASLPSGYRGYKLTGTSLRYTIKEALKQGLTYENGATYYYENGKSVTGWKTVAGDTYYFEKDGKAAKGWKWLNGAWYYFGSDGKMMTEWVRDGGKIYYCYDSGVMAKSTWLKLDGYWYYFYNDGRMAESEWVLSGGKWYFLAGDGRMATNTTIPGGYYVDSTGAWVK